MSSTVSRWLIDDDLMSQLCVSNTAQQFLEGLQRYLSRQQKKEKEKCVYCEVCLIYSKSYKLENR